MPSWSFELSAVALLFVLVRLYVWSGKVMIVVSDVKCVRHPLKMPFYLTCVVGTAVFNFSQFCLLTFA